MITFRFRFLCTRAPRLMNNKFDFIQRANITSRSTRGGPLRLQKPFPYNEKKLFWYHRLWDKTMIRLAEENAKIITVDGPIGVGKTAFAKALAEELDMLHMPEISPDVHYKLPSGYDIRQHDDAMPFLHKSFDHKDFCLNPKDVRTFLYQHRQLFYKFFQYVDALAHVMNTGQGVVIERSYYSDVVFMKAMYKNKYVSKEAYNAYYQCFKDSYTFLLPPHLIIYLDIPVPVVQERIRTRNYSYEQNSPALTTQYLQDLEYYYKNYFLQNFNEDSELLIYDWTDGGDIELICEDIENLDFDVLRKDKFQCWRIQRSLLFEQRQLYTRFKDNLIVYFEYPFYDVPECSEEMYILHRAYKELAKIPECKYDIGYNTSMGDSFWKILFKSNEEQHRLLKKHLLWPELKDI